MNRFYDMGEDAIERWHQIQMRHYARIRSLRSIEKQKANQAKYEFTTTSESINNVIKDVNEKTKRKFKESYVSRKITNDKQKKEERDDRRKEHKMIIENEERKVMPTACELLKQEYKDTHNL